MTIRKIKKYQKNIESFISKLSFQRLMKKIARKINVKFQFQFMIMIAIQKIVEIFFIMMFEDMYKIITLKYHIDSIKY